MNKIKLLIIIFILVIIGLVFVNYLYKADFKNTIINTNKNLFQTDNSELEDSDSNNIEANQLSIQFLRDGNYLGSDIVIEETLTPGNNYSRYIASYKSEGLKIYALLTIPNDSKPKNGWPVIIFNHGFIPPTQYVTTERYISYTDAFSRNGYIVFRSDYRGHGNSEGQASGGYGSNDYTIDILNAVASIKKLEDPSNVNSRLLIVDPERIGMWGHSMGGHITLRAMVVNKDIKAGVIWAGVVASYPDLLSKWRRGNTSTNVTPSVFPTNSTRGGWRQGFIEKYGTPEKNPTFWNSISSNSYLADISGPIQLHHGTADHSVPHEFSKTLSEQLKKAGKEVELYIYPGDEHDIPNNFVIAMQRSVEFFDKYLKTD